MSIAANVKAILAGLPPGVELVAAAKTRTPAEILEAVEAGVKVIGQNYVQEAAEAFAVVGRRARWHLIGHLQKNKAKRAVEIFDIIETIDSIGLGREIDKRAAAAGRTVEVLIEINSGREPQKTGVMPDEAEALVRTLAALPRLRVLGLMTMGPFEGDPEDSRPYFRETRRVRDALAKAAVPGVEMRHLSMGMSHSWRVAVEEGATIVRIGTAIFGPRPSRP
ncbi:MAG TPA: YggS family pyridoxal phosphate-dependent enzyme [Candidatus Aminicenantes bacterium]|mgnify:CR=1 FL=1|nr:YggS family pyridoxal phosphate-dependent enzyme [Candidatus Aminicenantes bacterium]